MDKKDFLQIINAAVLDAHIVQEKANDIYRVLTNCKTSEEAREAAGGVLGDVASLSGFVTLLLVEIDAVIKSEE